MKARHLIVPAIAALFTAFSTPERAAPTRWLFAVGVGDYMHFGDEPGGDLPGAAADARGIRDVLVARWGFPEDNVRMLLDRDAKREAIRDGFTEWLPSVVRPGDLVVFYYAGHGSQMWDVDGDEEDGLDETICPTDVTAGDTSRDIADDELGDWLDALPTDEIVVILDSCHSGTATRAVTPFSRPRTLGRDVTTDVPRPRGVTAEPEPITGGEESLDGATDAVLELAAAQADQVAVDAAWPAADGEPERYGGAFTTNLVENLWRAPTDASYERVFRRTVEDLKEQRFAQDPRISPANPRSARPAFSVPGQPEYAGAASGAGATGERAAGPASVQVLAVPAPDTAVLDGGRSAGMTAGSVYRAGELLLRVHAVEADRVRASIEPAQGAGPPAEADLPAPGASARLVAFRRGSPELRVSVAALPGAARTALARELDGPDGLRLVRDSAAYADLLVRPGDADRYSVLGADGAVRHRLPAATPAEGAAALAAALRRELGANRLAALDNPAQPFRLDFSFSGDQRTFGLGERIAFRIRSERDGYLTIVDLGTDGTVRVVFPNALDTDNAVNAGSELVVPTPAMQTEFRAVEPVGRGVVRAFVTPEPLELPFAEADVERARTVARALRAAVGGPPAGEGAALAVADWASAGIVYEIVR